jgi:hypothetical protein
MPPFLGFLEFAIDRAAAVFYVSQRPLTIDCSIPESYDSVIPGKLK